MNNLVKLLGGDKDADDSKSPSIDAIDDSDADNAPSNEGFDAAADELFNAIGSQDVDAFSSALKTCIEMYK